MQLNKLLTLIQTYIYAVPGLIAGFAIAWIIHLVQLTKSRKIQKSTEGFLESERLIKERLQKENTQLHQIRETAQNEYDARIRELKKVIRMMDEDILLLQKSNEETEALLHAGNPQIHTLKVKLIEANNTISRYKAQLPVS